MTGYISCTEPNCEGDGRYMPPGRGHKPGCQYLQRLQTTSVPPMLKTIRVGVYSLTSEQRLVDRYSDEQFFASRAENEPDKIFFHPTDPAWEDVWAYIGPPQSYVADEDGEHEGLWQDWTEILIEVRPGDGMVWYQKQMIHNDDLREIKASSWDVLGWVLNKMVVRIDEYITGKRPNPVEES